jgi:hypothetical protein
MRAQRGATLRITGLGAAPDCAILRLADNDELPDAAARMHVPTGEALLAIGHYERVASWLHEPAGAAALLMLARWLAWSGDLAFITQRWPSIRAAARELVRAVADRDTDAIATAAALERTATDAGDARLAAELHGAIRRARSGAAFDESARDVSRDHRSGSSNAAAAGLTQLLDRVALAADPAHDAALVAMIVYDLLGILPDATRGRIRIAPRLVDSVECVGFRDLRFSDGTVSAEIRSDRNRVDIVVRQDAGAIPFTVLLEPLVPGRVAACRVDGRPADLAPRPLASDTIVPVQLVLDEERHLEILLDA